MLHTSKGYLCVETDVPCASAIASWLCLTDRPFDQLIGPSRNFEAAYLAWETVRKARNPYFIEGTGFEGYFIGVYTSPDEMLARLLQLGHTLLDSNYRMYRFDSRFRSHLMDALVGEWLDYETLGVWSDLLGGMLARLRCNVHINEQALIFQAETYRMTSHLRPIAYCPSDRTIRQSYVLPFFLADHVQHIGLDLTALKPSDYDAGLVVDKIGCFGHPLVREFLRQHTPYVCLTRHVW